LAVAAGRGAFAGAVAADGAALIAVSVLASSALAGDAISPNEIAATLTPTRMLMLRSLEEYRITGSLTLTEVSYLTLIELIDRPLEQPPTISPPENPGESAIENLNPSRQDKKRHGNKPAHSRHLSCKAKFSPWSEQPGLYPYRSELCLCRRNQRRPRRELPYR
jgi:hypothetical protein